MTKVSDPGFSLIPPPPSERLWTVADLAVLPEELPSGPALYELDNGRLITMPPPGDLHGAVLKVSSPLFTQGEERGHGKARCGDVGIVLWRNPDRVVGADAVFIANSSLPLRISREGYLETIPDLIVEIMSKNDSWAAVRRKVEDYLNVGARVVWIVDPEARTVTAFRRGQETVHNEKDILTVEDIIPGFQLPVARIFQE
jgi:Uma2 family endonuclease